MNSESLSSPVAGEHPSTAPRPTSRQCAVCTEPISEKRLRWVPDAIMCVTCQEEQGDVPRIKRFDEYVGEDQVSTYFYRNDRIESEIARTNGAALDAKALELLVRDNSFARSEMDNAVAKYEGMAASFEPEEEEELKAELATAA